jgi:hypothetical protein
MALRMHHASRIALVMSSLSLSGYAQQPADPSQAQSQQPWSGPSRPSTSRPPPAGTDWHAGRAVDPDRDSWYSSGLFGTDPREPVYLPVGLLLSWPFERVLGLGGEVSLDVYHLRDYHWGFVAQAEYELSAGPDRGRFALGPQIGIPGLGVEVAAALRTATSEHSASLALHVAPYVSLLGFGSVALRIQSPGLALDASEREPWPAELGLALTVKWPVPLQSSLYCTGRADYCQPGVSRPPH